MTSAATPFAGQVVAQRIARRARVADAEAALDFAGEAAAGEIIARLGAGRRLQLRLEICGRELHHLVQRLRRSPPRSPRAVAGSATPGLGGQPLDRLREAKPSVSITKVKMSPCLPERSSGRTPSGR